MVECSLCGNELGWNVKEILEHLYLVHNEKRAAKLMDTASKAGLDIESDIILVPRNEL
jgi:hypothetical protein